MDRHINLRVIASLDRIRCKRVVWLGEALLNTPAWDVLFCLYKLKNGADEPRVAEEILLSAELLPRWMAILEQRNLVSCHPVARNYCLTRKGMEAVEDVLSVAYGSDKEVLAS